MFASPQCSLTSKRTGTKDVATPTRPWTFKFNLKKKDEFRNLFRLYVILPRNLCLLVGKFMVKPSPFAHYVDSRIRITNSDH